MIEFIESVVEDAALARLEALGYAVKHGLEIATGEGAAERSDQGYCQVVAELRPQSVLWPKVAFGASPARIAGNLSEMAT